MCDTNDIASPALLLIGLLMLGWAPGPDGLMPRLKPPSRSVTDFRQSREKRNEKILNSIKASADAELQAEAFRKTMDEADRGVLVGPYLTVEDIPLPEIALVPRHGIWEQHGGAVERSSRCIDDMLSGEQNANVGPTVPPTPTAWWHRYARCDAFTHVGRYGVGHATSRRLKNKCLATR